MVSVRLNALARAEVEYEDQVSPSIWVKFAVVGGGKNEAAKNCQDASAVIWTTTPWTIPHNRALAFHPDYQYAVVQTEKGNCCWLSIESPRSSPNAR